MNLSNYLKRIEKKEFHIPLDTESDRFRICPNCFYEFMAIDLRQQYCCDQCKDDYNNEIKRQERLKLQGIKIENDYKSRLTPREKNLSVLDHLFQNDDPKIYRLFAELEREGFDLTTYDSICELEDPGDGIKRNYIEIGPYQICRWDKETVLITKTK